MNTSFKQNLKAKAHKLKPIVLIGAKGLTPAVIEETNNALLAHELIKIKISGADKLQKTSITEHLCQTLKAELIQMIGNIVIIYRKNEKN